MEVIGLEDVIPLAEFAAKRREYAAAHRRYLDRYRRVRLGPKVTLVFENRQTLWYRVQEVLRLARLAEPRRVQQELDLYNRLLPSRDRLQAALIIAVDESRLAEELEPWRELRGEQLSLHVGAARFSCNLLTCRPEDRCVGAAHWVQFVLDTEGRRLLASGVPVHMSIDLPGYSYDSGLLDSDVRKSLSDDLIFSNRAA